MTKRRGQNYERQTLQLFWQATLSHPRLLATTALHFVSVICLNVAVPLLISLTLADIVTRHSHLEATLIPLGIAAAVGVLCNLVGFGAAVKLSALVQLDALEIATRTLLSRSVGFHANNIGGKLVNNALEFSAAMGSFMEALYVNLMPFVVVMAAGLTVIFSRSITLGFAMVVLLATTIAIIAFASHRRSSLRTRRKEAQNDMVANFSDIIVNSQTVKMFAHEEKELAAHHRLDSLLASLRQRDWSGSVVIASIQMAVLLGLQIGLIVLLANMLQSDPRILGTGIFAFTYTLTLISRLHDVGSMIRNLEEAFIRAASMTKIILEQPEITDRPGAKDLAVRGGAIAIRGVTFAYNDSRQDASVFKGLSLAISPGQKVGLIGPSGGGKSTLTKLLLRFDDATKGSIQIDGQDIRSVSQHSLRRAIAYVPQEPLLFHRSIRENIAYGRAGATDAEVRAAAKEAFADEFITRLPNAYQTIVGERGVKLSGGQRQRIALARAILKDAPVLILDEATSALDSESEVYIQRALARLMKGRTTIVVAHRLSTIQKMDRIIVLDEGKIVEDGPHSQLLKADRLYARLWAHQSGGFIEE